MTFRRMNRPICVRHILAYAIVFVVLISGVVLGASTDMKELCEMCKSMSEAFSKKVKETAKSNFGGGNTRWEEKSLGSYTFSETRLIEITEALCSQTTDEKKALLDSELDGNKSAIPANVTEYPNGGSGNASTDGMPAKRRRKGIATEYMEFYHSIQCHAILESNEELFEYYWFNIFKADPEKADIYDWLCIKDKEVASLKEGSFYHPACCTPGLFGPNCSPCNGGPENACSGHGKCNGDGTRGGTGKCFCDGGYMGVVCDQCSSGFYDARVEVKEGTWPDCKACHISCKSCSGDQANQCLECRDGYRKNSDNETTVCEDLDECQNKTLCESGKYCTNTVGSYVCMPCDLACDQCLGSGNDKCVKCRSGYHMQDNRCVDIDECSWGTLCQGENMYCQNTKGSYKCQCRGQYEVVGDKCMRKPPDPNLPPEPESSDSDSDMSSEENGEDDGEMKEVDEIEDVQDEFHSETQSKDEL